MTIRAFQKLVKKYYAAHGRHDLPWRPPSPRLRLKLRSGTVKFRKNKTTLDPYYILVSEVMLQQTQVSRVIPKYREFIRTFPNFRPLAKAKTADVLRAWQGLGYNRRALYLKTTAERVVHEFGGELPRDIETLKTFPGIGPNTAGSIAAFAFNIPAVFIETNIRRVFLHHFFSAHKEYSLDKKQKNPSEARRAKEGTVDDALLLPLVERTLDWRNPRVWYSALMDYGAYLGEHLPKTKNPNRRSRHYAKQPKFKGSDRELRGSIVKALLRGDSVRSLRQEADRVRLGRVLQSLLRERIIERRGKGYRIASE